MQTLDNNKNKRVKRETKSLFEQTPIWKEQILELMSRGFSKEEANLILRMNMNSINYYNNSNRLNMRGSGFNGNLHSIGQFR